MGTYLITINGTGPHGNVPGNDLSDADKLAAEFVKELKSRGHEVTTALFTVQATQDLKAGD